SRARESMARHLDAMVAFLDRGAEVFDYGNSLRAEARLGGSPRALDYPGFVPAYIRPLFIEGKGPFRWVALSGDPPDLAATDGSDAIADWPIFNALLITSSGASWVSVHHGGGVGIGRSIHAGMVVVADGSDAAAKKLERVLTNDPGSGVMRHADAGYERAIEVANERGVRIPMNE